MSDRMDITMCFDGYLGKVAPDVRQGGYYDVFLWLPGEGCR